MPHWPPEVDQMTDSSLSENRSAAASTDADADAGAATDTGRAEAFSDGVFAIAVTLLVLELRVPRDVEAGRLWHELARDWPSLSGYLVSFFVIGIMWVNHHAMFRLIVRIDRVGLFLNLLLLLFTAAIPFTTALIAEYLNVGGANAHVAAAVYSATLLCCAVVFTAMWVHAVRGGRLVATRLSPAEERASIFRYGVGVLIYAFTVALSFLSAPLTLGVQLLIALYYCFDQLMLGRD
jgi:uncharacterized membrane protein